MALSIIFNLDHKGLSQKPLKGLGLAPYKSEVAKRCRPQRLRYPSAIMVFLALSAALQSRGIVAA